MPDKPNTERPQRIDLPGGYALLWNPIEGKEWKRWVSIVDSSGCCIFELKTEEDLDRWQAFAAAMAPQEAAGSMDGLREALARIKETADCAVTRQDITNAVVDISIMAHKALAASPAAQHEAMAPAVELNELLIFTSRQNAIREAELRGVKAALTAASNIAHSQGLYSETYVDESSRPVDVHHHNRGVWAARDAIRALNPETILEGK